MRRRIGIFWKYFIAYSATATIVIFAFTIIMDIMIQRRYQEITYNELKGYALFASEGFKKAFDMEPAQMDKLAKDFGKQIGVRITIIQPDGKVIADSERNPEQMENHGDRPEIQAALSGGVGAIARYSTTVEEKMGYVAIPVMEDGKIKGVIRISIRLGTLELITKGFTRRVALISFAVWIVTLTLTFFFSSLFSASVKRLVNFTKDLAKGDLSKRGIVKGSDEISEITVGLNDMSRNLQTLFSQLQTQRDESNAIINSMVEGVLVLDNNLNVSLVNNSFRNTFSIEGEIIGRSYIEALRLAPLKEMVDELLLSYQVKGKRMEFGGKVFQGNGMRFKGDVENAGGLVLVFHDITADAEIDKFKADFVANASHELRTPLTAIKGYLETLEDEDPETQKNFIQIIRRNVDRISNLVSDLLLLSRLESPVPQINIEEVDLHNIADNVVKLVGRAAREKNLSLKVDIKPDIIVSGDAFLLEQMLLNLLDNAVKYTEQGEIILKAEKSGENVVIQVSDTGVGIPQKHIPRIFERFYRVDKGRSRDLGGTGLGLSIVKHILQLHNGEIHVESHVGRGTTFTVFLRSDV